MTRDEAWTLFCEWTASESLRRHVLAVEACMRAYAEQFGEDPERWGMVGMLHDLDYERYPDLHTGHPRYALAELERLGFPEDMVRAVASHADYLEVSRDTPMVPSQVRGLFRVSWHELPFSSRPVGPQGLPTELRVAPPA